MNTKPPVELIKKAERQGPEAYARTGFFVGPNRWSTAVRSWVREFQQDRSGESIPAFDSLFKDTFRSRSRTP
jgi:hypothetical protein